jgi:hypothetical protein
MNLVQLPQAHLFVLTKNLSSISEYLLRWILSLELLSQNQHHSFFIGCHIIQSSSEQPLCFIPYLPDISLNCLLICATLNIHSLYFADCIQSPTLNYIIIPLSDLILRLLACVLVCIHLYRL